MQVNHHRVAPTASIPPHTTKPRNPQNQQKKSKQQVTNPVPFLTTFQQWFKPEKKGDVENGK